MHCFNHQDQVAVGSCKACAKGLCSSCAVDLGHGLSCKGHHEEIVESYNSILNFNKKAASFTPKNIYLSPIFMVALGSVLLWYGRNHSDYSSAMGGIFVAYGAILFARIRATYARTQA